MERPPVGAAFFAFWALNRLICKGGIPPDAIIGPCFPGTWVEAVNREWLRKAKGLAPTSFTKYRLFKAMGMSMGDFERTFGAGADAVAIVDSYSREQVREFDGGSGLHLTASPLASKWEDGDTIFAQLDSGLYLVKKTSIETFCAEIASIDEQSHYPHLVENVEGSLFLALRDSKGRGCAFVQVIDDEVQKIFGLEDENFQIIDLKGVPVSDILFGAFSDRKWIIGTAFAQYGWITGVARKRHAVDDLPTRLTTSTGLNLRNFPIAVLPEELTIGGDFILSGTKIQQLPNRLTVAGNLYLEDTVLIRLPKDLTVGGLIFVDGYRVVFPPRGSVTDKFDVHGIPYPGRARVTVGGNLYLDLAALSVLPNGATVIAPDLDFGYCLKKLIDRIPAGVNCMGLGRDPA